MPSRDLPEFLSALYNCAIDPNLWSRVLPLLADYMESEKATLTRRSRSASKPNFHVEHGFNAALHEAYITQFAAINPIPAASALYAIDEAVRLIDILDYDEFLTTRYNLEFREPYQIGDLLTVLLADDDSEVTKLSFNRQKPYERADALKLEELCPHVRRVLMISDLLGRRTIERDALAETLDALTVSVFLIDPNHRIKYANAAARECAAKGDVLRVVGGALTARDPQSQSALRSATASPDHTATSIPLRSDESVAVATVLPLNSGLRETRARAFPATAAIFVQNAADENPTLSIDYRRAFRLTGAEARVLSGLLEGSSIGEIAELHGISIATARTHLQRIFSKTNTNRQSDLIRTVSAAIAPVRASLGNHAIKHLNSFSSLCAGKSPS